MGEQGHARGVPPLVHLAQHESAVDGSASRHELLRANFNQRCGLLNTGIGRRFVPPDKRDAIGEMVNRSNRGVSDHAIWPLGLVLRALRAWTLRIVVPPHLPKIGQRAKQVVWNHC